MSVNQPETLRHTPTPWKAACFLVTGPNGDWVCHTGMGNLPPSRSHESEANAAFIVTAVNSHERLTARVAELEEAMRGTREPGFIKPDNDRQVFFYEQDFYILSNFSAFSIEWNGKTFPTSEHAYHYERFPIHGAWPQRAEILKARSAHDAFRYAQDNRRWQREDWDAVKVDTMRSILCAKADQHEYVRRKLLATGDRELIEDSWRDDFWGWGPNRDGKNMLGKLWMEIRAALSAADGGRHG